MFRPQISPWHPPAFTLRFLDGDPPPESPEPPEAPPVNLVNPDGTYAADWLDRLEVDDEVKADQQLRTHKGLADTTRNLHELMKLRGHHVVPIPPDGSQDPKLWDEVYSRLGRPETPEGYTTPSLDDVPETQRMPAEMLKAVQAVMHAAGVSDRQWQQISGGWNKLMAEAIQSREAQAAEALNPLRAEWGGSFDGNLALVEKFLRSNVPPERFDAAMAAAQGQPDLLKLLHGTAQSHVEGEPDLTNTPASVLTAVESELRKLTSGDQASPYFNNYHPEHQATIQRVAELRQILAGAKPKTKEPGFSLA